MQQYGDATYGDAFADVYDEWYGAVSDVEATVARVAALAAETGGPVLELGVGTGRLAIALAARGVEVHGVDASTEMVDRLRSKAASDAVQVTIGPMDGHEPAGPFGVVFVAFNTLFNLTSAAAQQACMRSVAERLVPGGVFAVEGAVPADTAEAAPAALEVRTVELDRVVLVATERDADGRTVAGQHIELSRTGIRLRPWRIRMATPAELDAMASAAGLTLDAQWSDWSGTPFSDQSAARVALYRRMAP